MTKKNVTLYDKKDIYETEILPLLENIKRICFLNKIPFAASFAVENTNSDTTYENTALIPSTMRLDGGTETVSLSCDNFGKILLALQKQSVVSLSVKDDISKDIDSFDDIDISVGDQFSS